MLRKYLLKREYLFPAILLCLMVVCYQLAIKNTLAAWQKHLALTRQVQQTDNLSYQPDYLERKNANINRIIQSYDGDTAIFRNKVINDLSLIASAENVRLINIPATSVAATANSIFTQELAFTGDFFSLLKFTDKINSLSGVGKLRQFSIRKVMDNKVQANSGGLLLEISMEIKK